MLYHNSVFHKMHWITVTWKIFLIGHYPTLGCLDIAGTYYQGGSATEIDFDNGQLKGQWLNISRPPFTGSVGADCMGDMNFPDDRTYTLEYDRNLKTIFWDGRTSGNVWTKGNLSCLMRKSWSKYSRKRELI